MTRVASAAIVLAATIWGRSTPPRLPAPPRTPPPRADPSSSPSSLPSACGHDASRPLVARAGVVTDGSGANRLYLPRTNCSWVIAPRRTNASDPSASASGGVTLVFERFSAVFDDDFLFVSDASESLPFRGRSERHTGRRTSQSDDASDASLAAYTGALPVPFAARFDGVEALRLGLRDPRREPRRGVRARYSAGAACPGGCGGRGRCAAGLCACDEGWTGATCSTPLPLLSTNGSKLEAVAGVGETALVQARRPAERWGKNRRRRRRAGVPGRRDRRAPSAHGRARLFRRRSPDALRRVRDDDQRVMRVVRRFVRVDARRRRARASRAPLGRCRRTSPRRPRLRAFRGVPPRGRAAAAAGRVRAPGHPAPGVAHAGLPPPGSAARLEPAPRRAGTSSAWPARAGAALAPGEWVVGVTNADEKPLPSVLAQTRHFGRPVVGSQTRVRGRGAPVRFTVSPRAPCATTPPRGRVRRRRLRARRRRLRRRRLPLRARPRRLERR